MSKKLSDLSYIKIPFSAEPLQSSVILLNQIAAALMPVAQMLATAYFVDNALDIFKNGKPARILPPLLLLMLIVVYQNVNRAVVNLVNVYFTAGLKEKCEIQIIDKIAKLEYKHIEDDQTNELINRINQGYSEKVETGFKTCIRAAGIFIRIVSVLYVLVFRVWWAAAGLVVFSAPLVLVSLRSGKRNYEAYKEAAVYQRRAKYLESVLIDKEAAEERNLFRFSEDLEKRWFEQYNIARNIKLKAVAKEIINMKLASFLTAAVSIIIVGSLIYPLYAGSITIGMFIGMATAIFDFISLASWELADTANQLVQNHEYLKEFQTFIALSEKPDAVTGRKTGTGEPPSISFQNVSFKYPNTDRYILKDLSMELKPRTHYAFVGRNGAGKTTITKLLTGMYTDYEGDILINSKNIRDIPETAIKGMFSVVFQDYARYFIPVRDSLTIGNPEDVPDNLLYQALDNVGIEDSVKAMPDQLNTPLGKIKDEGTEVSGGQWQRIALARAIVNNAPVQILDEPTASIDPAAESNIYNMFGKLSKGKLTVFITHRLGAARLADEIIVIDEGKVAEKGSHDGLLAANGLYAEMFEEQRGWYRE